MQQGVLAGVPWGVAAYRPCPRLFMEHRAEGAWEAVSLVSVEEQIQLPGYMGQPPGTALPWRPTQPEGSAIQRTVSPTAERT